MKNSLASLALVVSLAAGGGLVPPAAAQQGPTLGGGGAAQPSAPAGGGAPAQAPLPTGTPVGQPSTAYVKEKVGDWEIRCVKPGGDASEICQLHQLVHGQDGSPILEVTVFDVPDQGKVVAGASVMAPLETLLLEGLTISIDGGEAKRYPFVFCNRVGCVAQLGLTADELTAMRRGTQAVLLIRPAARPSVAVTGTLSLKGFTAAFDKIATDSRSK